MFPTLEQWHWLVEGKGREILDRWNGSDAPELAISKQLRSALDSESARAVLAQIMLRRRARRRFPMAHRMFFTDRGLQQATDPILADYKAHRFDATGHIVDLCCGIGGDLVEFAKRSRSTGVDVDPVCAYLAEHNLRSLGVASGSALRSNAELYAVSPDAAIHIDPDRRPTGTRTTHLEGHEPGPELLKRLTQHPAGLAIKLAPATDRTIAWLDDAEWEWIGHHRQCQQLVAWCGPLARDPGRRVATWLDDKGRPHRLVQSQANPTLELATSLQPFIFEPVPSVLAAGLAHQLAQQEGWQTLTPGGGYMTGARQVQSGFWQAFEVIAQLPFKLKPIQRAIETEGIGAVEIKQRGVQVDLGRWQQKLKRRDGDPAVVFLLRWGKRETAILTRRLPSGESRDA